MLRAGEEDKWILKCRTLEIEGTRFRGRGKKKWVEVVEKDMKALGLKKTDVQDRGKWRRKIGGETSDLCWHGQNRHKMMMMISFF